MNAYHALLLILFTAVVEKGLLFQIRKSVIRCNCAVRMAAVEDEKSQPPIISFDQGSEFARPDIPLPKQTVGSPESMVPVKNPSVRPDLNTSPGEVGLKNEERDRRQAIFTIRSISLISIMCGVIFTVIWYLFPGQFVSFRGDIHVPIEKVARPVQESSGPPENQ